MNLQTTRRGMLAAVAALLIATSCAARNDEDSSGTEESNGEQTSEETTGEPQGATFGDLPSPCGPGELAVEASEAAGSIDKLLIGVPNDRTSMIRPGLNKELWDTSTAFADWCNAQGGIGGLEIDLVDLDGKLLEVEASMSRACNSVFMMAGGGHVQDNLQFSDKPDSDFHLCGLADIPAFDASPEKAASNGQVQPLPNPPTEAPGLWLVDFKNLDADAAESMVVVWGDLPALEVIKNKTVAIIEDMNVELAGVIDYPVTGLADWTPVAQQVIGMGATSLQFVGEPTNLGALVKSLREQGWDGVPIVESNIYDQTYIDSAGASNAEGTLIRSLFHPFEEADRWPAVQQYLDILQQNSDDPKVAFLGMQSFSSWLLFATAAKACGESNEGVLTRECVLSAAADVDEWTAGGLHAPTDPGPGGGAAPPCGMLITVNSDGEFERYFPEIGESDDALDGFSCDDDSVVEVPANEGLGNVSADQPI